MKQSWAVAHLTMAGKAFAESVMILSAIPAWLRSGLCYLLVLGVACCCFVVNRADPPYIFWDENYHVTSAERYLEGIAQFEPHPPLGLMLIAAGEALSGANAGIDKQVLTTTKQINGNSLPAGFSFAGMRLMPSVFAALGALVFFGLMLELVQHRLHALLLSSLYVFENAFVVHFRATHLDGFQMFFALAALWQFVRLWRKTEPLGGLDYFALSTLCALAIMIKVNAAFLLVLFPVLYFKDARTQGVREPSARAVDFAVKSGSAVLALALVTMAVFYVHALVSRTPPAATTSAGRQDLANMSPAYRESLEQHRPVTPATVLIIIRDYFAFMDKDHRSAPKLDTKKRGENGSHPLHWPFHDRNINYRWDSANGKTAYVELVGNQFSWYFGTAAVLGSLLLIVRHRLLGFVLRGDVRTYHLIEVFAGLYLAFMSLHLWIITQRVMYLYHYFLGLMISYLLIALVWRYLCESYETLAKHRHAMLSAFAGVVLVSYLFFLPLTNHWPLSKRECERRNIGISHILDCR